MLRLRRPAAALLLLVTLWPTLVFGQAPPAPVPKAGVVTTLEGSVTATRVALPQPVPLKFKDDVFLNDKIVTGDRSIARMLLGGKAVVTVRERSVLTITEIPGKSTIEIESGKIALAVAREKMRPGEQIEIKTPNATAGVRGTVVVTEVSRAGAQLTPGLPAVVTNFYVLRGVITALAQLISAGQNARFVGNLPPTIQPNPPLGQIIAGLQTSGHHHTQAANQEQVTQGQVQAAIVLLETFFGGGGEGGLGGNGPTPIVTTLDPPKLQLNQCPPICPLPPLPTGPLPLVPVIGQSLGPLSAPLVDVTSGPAPNLISVFPPPEPPPWATAVGPDPNISGPNGGPTLGLLGSSISVSGGPAIVNVSGTAATADSVLVSVLGHLEGFPTSLSSNVPLLSLASTVSIGGALFLGDLAGHVGRANFTSDMFNLTTGMLTSTGDLVTIAPVAAPPLNELTLGGSLLRLSGGSPTVVIGGNVLNSAGTVIGATTLVDVAAGTLTVGGALANVSGGSLTLSAGPPVRVSGASLTAGALFAGTGGSISLTGSVELLNASVSLTTPTRAACGVSCAVKSRPRSMGTPMAAK